MLTSRLNKLVSHTARRFSSGAVDSPIGESLEKLFIKRFEVVPETLFRVQVRLPVRLRSFDDQMALGRTSYDLKLTDGLVLPAQGDEFSGPNGMSLRSPSEDLFTLVRNFKGTPTVYTLSPGVVLPERLILLYEHSDHFSMQARVPMTLEELNHELTTFLKTLPSQTKEEFVAQANKEELKD